MDETLYSVVITRQKHVFFFFTLYQLANTWCAQKQANSTVAKSNVWAFLPMIKEIYKTKA